VTVADLTQFTAVGAYDNFKVAVYLSAEEHMAASAFNRNIAGCSIDVHLVPAALARRQLPPYIPLIHVLEDSVQISMV